MFLLTDLTEAGFHQIRNDRNALAEKIKQYQVIVDEFDTVLPFLEALYEPKIELSFKENIGHYIASTSIPYQGKSIHLSCKLGTKDDFTEIDNPKLLDKAKSKIQIEIARKFPLHFGQE